jgi:Kef-type K+ transport system membrane component KefB
MFNIGLNVHLEELARVGRVAGVAGVLGAVLPLLLTLGLTALFNFPTEAGLFAGVTLAATSVSISAQVLLELGVLRTKEGNALLATALIDDVVAILLLSLVVAVTTAGGNVDMGELVLIILRMAAYITVAFLIAWFIVPRLVALVSRLGEGNPFAVPAFALALALIFGWSADHFGGVAAITGAFIAGVGLSRVRESFKHSIDNAVSNIAYVFLVPVFFVNVGLSTDLRAFPLSALPFALLLLAVAVVSKLVGCGGGARVAGFNNIESLRLGVCMVSRGEVGLIIASIGISTGVFGADSVLFPSLFLVILLTTVLTPPLVRWVFGSNGTGPGISLPLARKV